MTIRTRLTLSYVGAIVLVAGVVTGLVWWQVGIALRSSLDQALDTRAVAASSAYENGQTGLQETNAIASSIIFIAVFAPDGSLVESSASAPPGVGSLGTNAAGTVTIDGLQYAIRSVPLGGGGRLVAGTTLAALTGTLDGLARSMLVVWVVVGLASLAAGWWLAGRALRPVALITQEAREINAENLGRRVPVPNQRDELSALATTLNAMLDRVAASVQRQRAFVASASHDLRTPIATLQAELELAQEATASADEMRAAIRAAHADVVRLGELATGLLDLAAVDEDGRTLVRSPIRIDSILDSVARRVEPVGRARGASIRTQAPGRLVRVDRVRLEQALVNLAINAVTYGPDNGVIEIDARIEEGEPAAGSGSAPRRGDVLAIDVLDRGPGIQADMATGLFVPFARGHRSAGAGSGLGLATAAAAIRAHHGSIGFDPRPGGGSRFWIRLPI